MTPRSPWSWLAVLGLALLVSGCWLAISLLVVPTFMDLARQTSPSCSQAVFGTPSTAVPPPPKGRGEPAAAATPAPPGGGRGGVTEHSRPGTSSRRERHPPGGIA